jgi:hypothetical protein
MRRGAWKSRGGRVIEGEGGRRYTLISLRYDRESMFTIW